jgi:hypothetical protein
MKFFKLAALATVASLGLASMPASAATINLSGVQAANVNASADDVDQTAVALNANIGQVVDSVVDVAATAANNVATIDVDVDQSATGLVSGNASLVQVANVNAQLDDVDQIAVAGNLSGRLNNTALNVGATAANNVASAAVITVQD